jgi:hypothetical protein
MQGITYFDYKYLYDNLEKIKSQAESLGLPAEHLLAIQKYQDKLAEMYGKYEAALNKLAFIVNQYKDHQKSINQLHIIHRRNKARYKKNISNKNTVVTMKQVTINLIKK